MLRLAGERKQRIETVVQRMKNWIGHVLCSDKLMKDVLEGRMVGKRPPGRPRQEMIDELKEGSYVTMKRRALYFECRKPA